MTHDNNTRTKANAVFFSAIMVISMLAVGFAAAPAAAGNTADAGSIAFDNQDGTSSVTTTVSDVNDTAGDSTTGITVVITNPDAEVVGVNSTTVNNNNAVDVTVSLNSAYAVDGAEHTAHLFDQATTNRSALTDGQDAAPLVSQQLDSDSALVGARGSGVTTKNVDDGATVYQGEEVNFVGALSGQTQLIGVSGDADGQILEENVESDQTRGQYTVNGSSAAAGVTVTRPRINDAEVRIASNGEDISGTSVSTNDAASLNVWAEYNFERAEPLAVTVEDASGTDITDEVTTGSQVISTSGGTVNLDMQDEDSGEYTVIVEGDDDLDNAVEELTFELTSDTDVSIDVAQDSVTRGSNTDYTVSGGTSGNFHAVSIDRDDFRSNFNASNNPKIFRNAADTDRVGYTDGSTFSTTADAFYTGNGEDTITQAVAVVEMDGSQGSGSLRTANLDDSTIDVEVYDETVADSAVDGADSVDDDSFDVNEGEVTIGSPTGQYTIGSEVDINGTATSADAVDIYVRDNNDWELLAQDIDVDSNDEYEREDVQLSNTGQPGDSLLRQAGTYRYGVVDASESNSRNTLTTTQFSRASSTSQSIRTVEGELSAQVETINGQINYDVDDAGDLTGNAEGQNSVALVFVDRRGNVAVDEIDVDSDGTIDEEDYNIPARADNANARLSEGTVTAHFISQGRDDVIGDGEIPNQGSNSDVGALTNWVNNNVSSSNLNAQQVRDRIVSETTEDTASDDLMVTQTFRYAESQTTIDSVYPEEAQADGVNPVATGETMVVAGSTNLRPDDNSVTVEVLNEDGESLQISSTDQWENNGQWSATVDTSDLEPGTYTVESDDSTNTDRAEIEIVEERQQPDDGGDDTGGDDTGGDDSGSEDGGDGTDDSTPGFGALVALVALIAAALLATRRDN